MSLSPVPLNADLTEKGPLGNPPGNWVSSTWRTWLTQLFFFVGPLGGSGTTANRPTKGLYVGLAYFDTTLGFMVYVKTVASPAVWVRYDGTVV